VKPWHERPAELANLLNPAFGGLVLSTAVQSFQEQAGHGMPYPLAALVLPLILHKATRESLPRDTRTTLLAWLEREQALLPHFAPRVRSVLPYTQEAIRFLAGRDVLRLAGGGLLEIGSGQIGSTARLTRQSEEVRVCLNRAQFVGRWLAQAGETATVYQALGIQP
jgi:hypothetical protein